MFRKSWETATTQWHHEIQAKCFLRLFIQDPLGGSWNQQFCDCVHTDWKWERPGCDWFSKQLKAWTPIYNPFSCYLKVGTPEVAIIFGPTHLEISSWLDAKTASPKKQSRTIQNKLCTGNRFTILRLKIEYVLIGFSFIGLVERAPLRNPPLTWCRNGLSMSQNL